jgi:hypothetical protein
MAPKAQQNCHFVLLISTSPYTVRSVRSEKYNPANQSVHPPPKVWGVADKVVSEGLNDER